MLDFTVDKDDKELQDALTCPLSTGLFIEPVTSSICLHSFEKEMIEVWLEDSSECPMCRTHCKKDDLFPNQMLKNKVDDFLKKYPKLMPTEYIPNGIKTNNLAVLERFFAKYPEKINITFDNYFPLTYAIKEQKPEVVKIFLNIKTLNFVLMCQDGVLNLAASLESNDILQQLLNKGADPGLATTSDYTPLMYACVYNRISNIKSLLDCQKDLNINHRSSIVNSFSALHYAVTASTDAVRLLLSIKNIDVNIKNSQNESPFFLAAKHNKLESLKLLAQMPDIDVEAVEMFDCKTALQIAQEQGHMEVVAFLTSPEIQFSLVKNKLRHYDIEGAVSVLTELYKNGQQIENWKEMLELCKEKEADFCQVLLVNIFNRAQEKNDNALILLLLTPIKSQLNELLFDEYTVLQSAVRKNNKELVELLLQFNDIDVNVPHPISKILVYMMLVHYRTQRFSTYYLKERLISIVKIQIKPRYLR